MYSKPSTSTSMPKSHLLFPAIAHESIAIVLLTSLISLTIVALTDRIRERRFISSVRQDNFVATFDISLAISEFRNNNISIPESYFGALSTNTSLAINIFLVILAISAIIGLCVLRELKSKERKWPRAHAFLARTFCMSILILTAGLIITFVRTSNTYKSFADGRAILEVNGRLVFVAGAGLFEAESWICELAHYAAEVGSSALLSGEHYSLQLQCTYASRAKWWMVPQTVLVAVCFIVLWSLESKARGEKSRLLAVWDCGNRNSELQSKIREEVSEIDSSQPELSALDRSYELDSLRGGLIIQQPDVERVIELMTLNHRAELFAGEAASEMTVDARYGSTR